MCSGQAASPVMSTQASTWLEAFGGGRTTPEAAQAVEAEARRQQLRSNAAVLAQAPQQAQDGRAAAQDAGTAEDLSRRAGSQPVGQAGAARPPAELPGKVAAARGIASPAPAPAQPAQPALGDEHSGAQREALGSSEGAAGAQHRPASGLSAGGQAGHLRDQSPPVSPQTGRPCMRGTPECQKSPCQARAAE